MDRIYLGEELETFFREKAEIWHNSPYAEGFDSLSSYLFEMWTDEHNSLDILNKIIDVWTLNYCAENHITGQCTEQQDKEMLKREIAEYANTHKLTLYFPDNSDSFSLYPVGDCKKKSYHIPAEYSIVRSEYGIYIRKPFEYEKSCGIGIKDGAPVTLPDLIPLIEWAGDDETEFWAYINRL